MQVEGKAMSIQKLLITASAVALLTAVATTTAGARSAGSQPTPVTFLRSVELPGMTLPAGAYVFERANPESSLQVVLVRNQRGTVQWLGHTNVIERRAAGKTLVQVSEAGAGESPRVLSWFPSESTLGAAFIY